jgi:ABC-2 type transport system ATP-binding protein
VILDLQAVDKTILLTTHYMFEADQLCDRIAIINQGRLVALDTPSCLKEQVSDLSVIEIEVYGIPPEVYERIKSRPYVDSLAVDTLDQKQLLLVSSLRGAEAVPDLLADLSGLRLGRVQVREPTLEDAYVRLVGGAS